MKKYLVIQLCVHKITECDGVKDYHMANIIRRVIAENMYDAISIFHKETKGIEMRERKNTEAFLLSEIELIKQREPYRFFYWCLIVLNGLLAGFGLMYLLDLIFK